MRYMEIIKFINFSTKRFISPRSPQPHHADSVLCGCVTVNNCVRGAKLECDCVCVRLIKMHRLNETNAPAAKRMILQLIYWICSSITHYDRRTNELWIISLRYVCCFHSSEILLNDVLHSKSSSTHILHILWQ